MASEFICEEIVLALVCIECGSSFEGTKPRRGRARQRCPSCNKVRIRERVLRYRSEGRYPDYTKPGYGAQYYARKVGTPFVCAACGKTFVSRQTVAKYCSQACMAASISVILTARHGTRPKRPCEKCGKLFKPSRPNRRQKAAGYVQQFCGYECAGMPPRRTAPNRRKLSDALKANGYWKPVNPIVVFERDGWRCHLCGLKALKSLRGTNDDHAPEIDHILPIAAGGEHSYENCACAHRKCNRQKGQKPLGQLLLFG